MTARLVTRIRQIQLERIAATLVCERFPQAEVSSVKDLIVVKNGDRVGCLYFRASERHLSKEKRAEHGRLRAHKLQVFVCQSEMDIRFALDALPRLRRIEA
ncbi:MAG TPA: hypothetical protein VGV37_06215 [Aliidongia sp.]|uniref:hypothetical protein n=1 Tax=Aliidongia sp. TaxID=1914230 RepID=UPI002DDCC0F6|nr:hypothetical protein [Aliidongia sp.]HEV2674119.1 hypothetical protein [Aliidongia sp.]